MKRIIVFILIVMLFTTAIASCSKPSEETRIPTALLLPTRARVKSQMNPQNLLRKNR